MKIFELTKENLPDLLRSFSYHEYQITVDTNDNITSVVALLSDEEVKDDNV